MENSLHFGFLYVKTRLFYWCGGNFNVEYFSVWLHHYYYDNDRINKTVHVLLQLNLQTDLNYWMHQQWQWMYFNTGASQSTKQNKKKSVTNSMNSGQNV